MSAMTSSIALLLPLLPDNLGDVIYSFRFRIALPERVAKTQSDGAERVFELADKGHYRFCLVNANRILLQQDLVVIDVPDATPELIRAYALDDEQALLAIIRYNRLVDTFLDQRVSGGTFRRRQSRCSNDIRDGRNGSENSELWRR